MAIITSATGDKVNILHRLRALLPSSWFEDSGALITATLQGYAASAAFVFALYTYAKQQTRIATATGGWLDLIAGDFFGSSMQRRPGQDDISYRTTIRINILRERGTRAGLISVLRDITGNTPIVTEPRRALDAGAYGIGYGYGAAGAYSTVTLPYTAFVKVFRPSVGSGLSVTDAEIYAAIESVRPAATVIWVCILG